jgi:hypothetical protein
MQVPCKGQHLPLLLSSTLNEKGVLWSRIHPTMCKRGTEEKIERPAVPLRVAVTPEWLAEQEEKQERYRLSRVAWREKLKKHYGPDGRPLADASPPPVPEG